MPLRNRKRSVFWQLNFSKACLPDIWNSGCRWKMCGRTNGRVHGGLGGLTILRTRRRPFFIGTGSRMTVSEYEKSRTLPHARWCRSSQEPDSETTEKRPARHKDTMLLLVFRTRNQKNLLKTWLVYIIFWWNTTENELGNELPQVRSAVPMDKLSPCHGKFKPGIVFSVLFMRVGDGSFKTRLL